MLEHTATTTALFCSAATAHTTSYCLFLVFFSFIFRIFKKLKNTLGDVKLMGGKKRKRRAKEQRALQIFAVLNKWQKEGRRCSCSLGEEGERDGGGGREQGKGESTGAGAAPSDGASTKA